MSVITKAVDKLTVMPLLYVIGALLILSGVLGFSLKLAHADKAVAESKRDTANTERDAWKAKTVDAMAANTAYAAIIDKQARIVDEERAAAETAAQVAAQQVDKAQAEAAKAKTERDGYQRRFAAKPKNCEAALATMQAMCPTLEHY